MKNTTRRWSAAALLGLSLVLGACTNTKTPQDTTAPTASLTATTTAVTAPGTLTLEASAADSVGVTRVEFYDGETLLETVEAAPFTVPVQLTSAQNGEHTYTARAYDAAGNVGTSAAVTVRVNIPTAPVNTAPAAPKNLSAAASTSGVTLSWSSNTETNLAGYQVSAAASAGGPFELLTPQPIKETTYTDATAPEGVARYYRVVAVNTAGQASPPASTGATRPIAPPTGPKGQVALQNLDAVPGSDRMVFSRIGSLASPPSNRVHDRSTLRVRNTGEGELHITGLTVVGPWTVSAAPSVAAPLTVPAGGSLDLTVRFTAQGAGNVTGHLHEGSLSVVSDGGNASVKLAGLWQSQSENNTEPNIDEMRRVFGYAFNLVAPGTVVGDAQVVPGLDNLGRVTPDGDEVISAYWQRADTAQPATVTQIASYHTQGNRATLNWHPKGETGLRAIVTSDGTWAQSLLPAVEGGTGLTTASFTPSATFGLNVDNQEWSDPTLNDHRPDSAAGCAEPCGQHLRFWPVKDSAGQIVPNTYFVGMDYAGINYDYNDNLFVISNVKPAPLLVNVGGPTFTAPGGTVWTADQYTYRDRNSALQTYTYYTPPNGLAQPSTPYTGPIAGTDNPELYRTYRHNTLDTPLEQRVMTYRLPLENGTHAVKLHFAEINWNEAGKRVFNVDVEGVRKLTNFDIFAAAGGKYRAYVFPVNNVQVADGELTITLTTVVDHSNISGIEVTR